VCINFSADGVISDQDQLFRSLRFLRGAEKWVLPHDHGHRAVMWETQHFKGKSFPMTLIVFFRRIITGEVPAKVLSL
jgi:hypothetical protein